MNCWAEMAGGASMDGASRGTSAAGASSAGACGWNAAATSGSTRHTGQVFHREQRFLGGFLIPIANRQNADPQAAIVAAILDQHSGLLHAGFQYFFNAIEQRSGQDGVHAARRLAGVKSKDLARGAIGQQDAEVRRRGLTGRPGW